MCRLFFSLILISISVNYIKCDYYTSISGLEELLALEEIYLSALGQHLLELEKLKSDFDSFLDVLEDEYVSTQNEDDQYYEQPVNAFLTIRRIAADWQQLGTMAQQICNLKVYNESATITDVDVMLPNDDDVRGAVTGLSRLQQLYRLDITDLIQGHIKGQKYSSEMSTYNCFVMGVSLYESKEYLPASEWLIEALYKAENIDKMYENHISKEVDLPEDDPDKVDSLTYGIFPYPNIERILEYLGPALYEAGKQELAQIINTRLLQLEPDNQYGLTNKLLFESKVKTDRRKRIVTPAAEIPKMKDLYEQVCNGYLQKNPQEKRHLHCHYTHNNLPYYFLGPLKMELLNQDPFVAQYYDVIYENEIKQILQAVEDSIERSSIGSNNDSYIDEVRISKNSWLDYDAIFMQRISQRLQDITGLSMANSEEMQVANYGIGGYYGTHFDFSEDDHDFYPEQGNRILTAMFYLNKVDLGGSTAFPHLHLAVPPTKGSLVIWYDLHKSLKPDYRTAHAGCPVLKGSKWIGNVWFHAVGQEFKRPCGLNPDDTVSRPYKDMGLD